MTLRRTHNPNNTQSKVLYPQDTLPLIAADMSGISDEMMWVRVSAANPWASLLADRHYSRQNPGAAQFAPPGRKLVLITPAADALWVTSWPFAEYVRHEWAGAWICSLFRNESTYLSSTMVRAAVAATRHFYPDTPDLGMVTFVDTGKVRKKRDFGRCFLRAGFHFAGYTQAGLLALQMLPGEMPAPLPFSESL